MVSAFTPNIQLEEPARGDQVGTWDTPVNNNMTLIDFVCGNITTVALGGANITLSASQFQSKEVIFSGTLSANVSVTLPTSFIKSYEIQHLCAASSNFTITLKTTAAGGQVVCCPPGEIVDVVNDGTNIKFKNLGRVGSFWDYGGSSVPNWVSGCSIPPYLNCDGSAFSSASYPFLTVIFGGTTLPDSRGRGRYTLTQGTGRITAGISGVNGATNFAGGGNEAMQAHTHANTLTDLGHTHGYTQSQNATTTGGGGFAAALFGQGATTGSNNSTPMSITNASFGAGGSQNLPPAYIGGITMVRGG